MAILNFLFGIGKSAASKGASAVWENRKFLMLFLKTKFLSYRNKYVRFSISGLYKIQIPNTNKYLLVKNRKITDQLQPVGGAYKRFGDDSLFNDWMYKPDNSTNGLNVDDESASDLRFMVKGKYVLKVLKWFEKGRERETDPRREFVEELITTKILDGSNFQSFQQKHIRRYSKNLIWSKYFNCYEILIYDVFELIPNDLQKKELIQLAQLQNTLSRGFAIVECDCIEQLRLVQNNIQVARIGQHTKLIINQTF